MVSESVDSLREKARQAVAQGQHDEARRLYLQALAVKPDSPDVHYGLATVCFLLGDLTNAAHHFKEVTRLDPLRAGAHINLGAVYNRLDQVDDAIQVLRRGIQLDTHRAEGYYNLGLAYRRKKQIELAIQAYQEATRINPRMADAHLNLANAYLDKGQFGLAVSHYHHALEVRPNWEKAKHGLMQADAALETTKQQAAAASHSYAAEPAQEKTAESGAAATAVLDPERQVDPNIQGAMLTHLHRSTIESENLGRSFLTILEKEIEPAIKELSSALLYPDTSRVELDECVQKMEAAISNMRSAQRSLQSSMDQIHVHGLKLVKS